MNGDIGKGSALRRRRRLRDASKRRRARYERLPIPPARGEYKVPYAKDNPHLRDLDDGQLAAVVFSHPAFQEVYKTRCDEVDRQTKGSRGPKRSFKAWEIEACFAYGRLVGFQTWAAIRRALTNEEGGELPLPVRDGLRARPHVRPALRAQAEGQPVGGEDAGPTRQVRGLAPPQAHHRGGVARALGESSARAYQLAPLCGIVLQILMWDAAVPSDRSDVKVQDGWITVSGDVDYQFESDAADEDVATLFGVVGITNQIRVMTP